MVGLSQPGPITIHHAHSGGCHNLGPAEDDHNAGYGRPAGLHQSNDVVDDASNAGFLHIIFSQRSGSLLDYLQRDRGGHPVLPNRLGTPFQQTDTRPGASHPTVCAGVWRERE